MSPSSSSSSLGLGKCKAKKGTRPGNDNSIMCLTQHCAELLSSLVCCCYCSHKECQRLFARCCLNEGWCGTFSKHGLVDGGGGGAWMKMTTTRDTELWINYNLLFWLQSTIQHPTLQKNIIPPPPPLPPTPSPFVTIHVGVVIIVRGYLHHHHPFCLREEG